jgi:Flp pilus assembly protein TadG
MALTLSLLFSVCFGMIEFGCYFWVKNTMENAAREGCRAGIVQNATNAQVNQAIVTQLWAAGLLGTGADPTGSATLGNITATLSGGTTTSYTVSAYDASVSTSSKITDVSTVPVGDTLEITVTASWGTVGAAYRPLAIIGGTSGNKTILAATSMRKEG